MSPLVDLAMFSSEGQLTAVAEVKNRRGTSKEWAAQLRRNILAHGGFPKIDFFLMVTPDRLYLWNRGGNQPDVVEPAYEIDARPLFAPYFERSGVDPELVSGHAFELVVDAWLADLMHSDSDSANDAEVRNGLAESGFLTAIRDGRVEYETSGVNIYVETNFVLEIALAQEQHDSCKAILDLCSTDQAGLLIPAFSIAEPYQTLRRRHRQRRHTKRELDRELIQLARTAGYAQSLAGSQSLVDLLIDSTDEEARRLEATRAQLIEAATILPLDADILKAAAPYQSKYDLSAEDAIVYATVLSHLEDHASERSCFLNRNIKDFDDPDLVAELRQHGCKMIPRFDSGYQYITASLSEPLE